MPVHYAMSRIWHNLKIKRRVIKQWKKIWIRNKDKNHFIESGSPTNFQCYLRLDRTVGDSNGVAIGNETGFCNFSFDGKQNHAHPWNSSFIYNVPWDHYVALPRTHIQLISSFSFLFSPYQLQILVCSAAVFKTYPTDIKAVSRN